MAHRLGFGQPTGLDLGREALEMANAVHQDERYELFGLVMGDRLLSGEKLPKAMFVVDGKKVVRSYSISSTPTRPYILEITVKRVPGGLVSNWLADHVKVGDRVEIMSCRPMSRLKRWRLVRVVEKASAVSMRSPRCGASRAHSMRGATRRCRSRHPPRKNARNSSRLSA